MARKETRNAQGSGTIRQRKDGTWEARYTVGRDPGTGKQIQRSIYGKTQKDVRQRLQQVSVAIDDGLYIEPSKITVKQWLEVWLNEYIGNVKPYTERTYKMCVNRHIVPSLGALKLFTLNTHSIQAFYNGLMKGTEEKPGFSAKTVKNIHGVIHRSLKQAVLLGYMRNNPSDACTLPRKTPTEIKPLDDSEMASFLKIIQGHSFETLLKVDLFTGLRKGEVLGLQWACINFEKGTILINKQLQIETHKGGKYYLAPLKNDKARLISPAPYVMQALRDHKRMQNEKRLRAGDQWNEGDLPGLVFTNEFGGHLSHVTVGKHFKKLITKAGIPEARFHDLRHTYAVSSLRSGDDVKTVQENLGHHTAAFTLDIYGHVTEQMKKDSAQRMERFIKNIENL